MKNFYVVSKLVKAENTTAKDLLKYLVYQVNNGGILQYCNNGYADELLEYTKNHDILKELKELGCPQQGLEAMQKALTYFYSEQPSEECPDCGGEGQLEEEDEEGNVEFETCPLCSGDGEIVTSKWSEVSEKDWMNDFDNWFYSLPNMEELAKFVKEPTTFSHTFEAMKQQN